MYFFRFLPLPAEPAAFGSAAYYRDPAVHVFSPASGEREKHKNPPENSGKTSL
jgi:hypothetical protein